MNIPSTGWGKETASAGMGRTPAAQSILNQLVLGKGTQNDKPRIHFRRLAEQMRGCIFY